MMKWNYMTEKEAGWSPELFDLQIVLGLQGCNTKADVLKLLEDVRQHERLRVADEISKGISKLLIKDEKETQM